MDCKSGYSITIVSIQNMLVQIFDHFLVSHKDYTSVDFAQLMLTVEPKRKKELEVLGLIIPSASWVSTFMRDAGYRCTKPRVMGKTKYHEVVAFTAILVTAIHIYNPITGNMDETGYFISQLPLKTYHLSNTPNLITHIPHQKTRFTLGITSLSHGPVYPPFIISRDLDSGICGEISIDNSVSSSSLADVLHLVRDSENESLVIKVIEKDSQEKRVKITDYKKKEDDEPINNNNSQNFNNSTNNNISKKRQRETKKKPVISKKKKKNDNDGEDFLDENSVEFLDLLYRNAVNYGTNDFPLQFFDNPEYSRDIALKAIYLNDDIDNFTNKLYELYDNAPPDMKDGERTPSRRVVTLNDYIIPRYSKLTSFLRPTCELFPDTAISYENLDIFLQNIDDTDEKQPEIKKRPSLEDDIDFDDWMRGDTRMKKKIRQMLDKEFDYSDPIKYIEKYLNSANMKEKLSSKPVEPQPKLRVLHLRTQSKAWMDGVLFSDYLILYFSNVKNPTILIIDNCPGHVSKENLKLMDTFKNIIFIFLPANSTSLFQAMDVGYNGLLKRFCRTFTSNRSNNVIAMKELKMKHDSPYSLERNLVQFIDAMNSIAPEAVHNSFVEVIQNICIYFNLPFPVQQEEPQKTKKNKYKTYKMIGVISVRRRDRSDD